MDLRDLVHALRSGWVILLGGLLLGLGVAHVLVSRTPTLYSSTSRLFVSASTTDPTRLYDTNLLSQARMVSYSQLLTDESLAAKVVDELHLNMSPSEVAHKVDVALVPNSAILSITVFDTSYARAQAIDASLDRQFIAQVAALETQPGQSPADSPIKVSVLLPATVSSGAVSPDPTQYLAVGGIVGLLAGLAALLIRHRLDNTVKTGGDVRAATGTGVVGTLGKDRRLRRRLATSIDDGGSATAEAVRALRTQLRFSDAGGASRVIVVSSATKGEGKTTVAVNLAAALGRSGSRVMLIEADLRRPRMARRLGLAQDGGLATVLSGDAGVSAVAQEWEAGQATVLPAGGVPSGPSELLGSSRMRTLMQDLRQAYDVVVIDTPPLLAVTDAAVLSTMADGCLLVAGYRRVRREQLAEAAEILTRLDVRILGVVLNGIPPRVAHRAGYGFVKAYASDHRFVPAPRGSAEQGVGDRRA